MMTALYGISVQGSRGKMQDNAHDESRRTCERIRALAVQQGLTNVELARRSRVSYRLVHNIMSGSANLRPATVGKIAHALGLRAAELMPELPSAPVAREARQAWSTDASAGAKQAEKMTVSKACEYIAEQLGISPERLKKAISRAMIEDSHE